MPRTKKKTIAPIEKHTIPTVPAAEQPYQVPENWRWVRLGEIYVINPPVEGDDSMDVSFVPMEKVNPGMCSDFTFDILPWKQAKKGHTRFANGDIAFAKISPCFENRKAFIATGLLNGIGGGTTELIILRHPKILQKYTYYSIMADRFINGGVQTYSGTVGQQRISMDYVRNYPFPLPPLAEQQRIVDRIESLFAKLDEAREKAQAVVDGFENRKAAILHKAFTGELTRKWREERGIGMESWKTVHLEDVCNSIFDGDHMPPPKSERGIPFLVISNVNDGYLSYDNTRFVPHDYYEALSDTRKPKIGDLLYTLVGSYGIPVVVDNNRPFCFQRHMALLKPSNIDTYFLWYQMQTNEVYNQATNIATGTAQLTVPIKGLRKLKINFPIHDEQSEIVRLLDSFLTQDRRARDLAESVIAQIDLMKKAILARAFRGELGTNDPSEAACEG